jgi:hypothetical protein
VIINYKKGCTQLATASDKVYQLLSHGRWFSPGSLASSTTKTGRHDIAKILLKVVLKHQKSKSIKKHKRKQNHRDFTFKEQIKFQHLFYGNSKPDNVLCILFVTCHKSTIVMQDFYFLKFTSCFPMVGGSLWVLRLLPPLKLVAMI